MNPYIIPIGILFSAILSGICLLLGYFGETLRFCDVLSNFKEQIFLVCLALLLVSLLLKKLKKVNISITGLIIIITLFDILPWYYQQQEPDQNNKTFRIVLINVLKKNENYKKTLRFVHNISPDILVFMETDKKWLKQLEELDKIYQHKIVSSKLGNDAIVVYSVLPVIKSEEITLSKKGRPNFKITLKYNGKLIDCLVAHPVSPTRKEGKWEDRNEHISNLGKTANFADNPVIVIADLNTGMWSPFYKKLIKQTELENASRGFGIHGTYPAPFSLFSGIPIDHILLDEDFLCMDFKTGPHIGSDHLPIWADIYMKK